MANQTIHQDTTFHIGDTIRVHYKLIEKEKVAGKAKREVKEELRERIQVFEGIVLSIKGEGVNKTFTVRRIGVGNIGIERIFPLASPWIKKITVKRKGKVRRAKLYYLRNKVGKEAEKLKENLPVTPSLKKKVTVKRKVKLSKANTTAQKNPPLHESVKK